MVFLIIQENPKNFLKCDILIGSGAVRLEICL
jgi:hypothetical protein